MTPTPTPTPTPTRLARRLAIAGTTAALAIAAVSVPQMATARVAAQPGYSSCVSSTVSTLVSAGSVVRQRGASGTGYYTVGGRDFLGTDKRAIKSVAERSAGVWVSVPLCA